VTVAAVISDPETHRKLVIVDPRMVPKMAALDPALMTGLPPAITAATGIDALTHAIEAFVGNWKTPYSDGMALSAVGLIFENLRTAYNDGKNLAAREKMALASTYAGFAFTRANVGYVHAIAHQFGGLYHTPHGLANAIMLPLRAAVFPPGDHIQTGRAGGAGPGGPRRRAGRRTGREVPGGVEQLNRDLGIPTCLQALKEADIPELAKAACHEAHTGYPVPRYMTQEVCEGIIRRHCHRSQPRRRQPRPSRHRASARPPPEAMPGRRRRPAHAGQSGFWQYPPAPRPMQNRRSAWIQGTTRGAMQ
jgi:alcohol dehydrogenase class IV